MNRKLKKSEDELQLYREVIENMADGIFLIRPSDGVIVYANPAVEKIFGYRHGEMVGKHISTVNAPTDKSPEEVAREVIQSLNANGTWQGEVWNLKKDGTAFWCRANISTLTHPQYGNIWVAINQDVAEHKQAEQKIERLNMELKKLLADQTSRLEAEIIAHSEAASALQESEDRFRIAQDISLDAFTILRSVRDGQGRIVDFVWTYANPAAGRILKRPPEKLVGQRLLEILPGNRENKSLFERYVRIVETGQGDEVELEYRSEEIAGWFRNMAVKLGDGVAVSFSDITEQKQMEEVLHASEKKFRALFEHASDAVTLVDAAGNIVFESPSIARITGYTVEERLNMYSFEVLHPDDRGTAQTAFKKLLQIPGGSATMEFRVLHKDGSYRYMDCTATNLLDKPAIRAIVVNFRDITQRRWAEEKLYESEEKYRDIFEGAIEGIFQSTPDGRFISVNKAMVHIFGYDTADEMVASIGGNITTRLYVDPNRRAELMHILDQQGVVKEFEAECYRKDCSIIQIRINARTIYNANGTVLYYEGFLEDISERKQAEEELRESEERFSTAFHASSVAQTITVLESGLILDANEAFCDLMGYTHNELIGHTSKELGLWIDFKERQNMIQQLRLDGNLRNMELQLLNRSGQLHTVLVSIAMIVLKGKKCMISTLLDITERKRAETRNHLISEVQDILLHPCNLTDIHRLVSEKVRQLIGDGITATSIFDEKHKTMHMASYHGMDVPMEKVLSILGIDPLQTDVSLNDMTEEELRIYRSGRLEILTEGLYALMTRLVPKPACLVVEKLLRVHKIYTIGFIHNNEHLGGLIILARSDITPHIATIEQIVSLATIAMERKLAEKTLYESEERYRRLVDTSPDAISLSDLHGRIILCNQRAAALYGFENVEAVLGQNAFDFFAPEDRRQALENTRRTLAKGRVQNIEYTCLRRDGSRFPCEINASVLLDAADQPTAFIGIARDITERKQADEKLKEANKLLEEQLGEIKILRDYLHEQAIRDPLTGLYNRLYLYTTMERELARAKRENYSVSVMMIDIDHFKDFNDKYGHQAGDKILVALGGLLRNSIRQGDIACRYGGEEFIIIMPGACEADAERRAETIHRDFNNLHINYDGKNLSAAISIGLAFYPQHGSDMNQIIKAADSALYEAKQAGRNRVRVWKNA